MVAYLPQVQDLMAVLDGFQSTEYSGLRTPRIWVYGNRESGVQATARAGAILDITTKNVLRAVPMVRNSIVDHWLASPSQI